MKSDRGFSLLEILVAFTLLALTLGILMQIFSGSLRGASAGRDQAQAATLGQSLLAGLGAEGPMVAGETSGIIAERFHWSIRIMPYPDAARTAVPDQPHGLPVLDLWQIDIRISWRDGDDAPERALSIATLRVQKPPQP